MSYKTYRKVGDIVLELGTKPYVMALKDLRCGDWSTELIQKRGPMKAGTIGQVIDLVNNYYGNFLLVEGKDKVKRYLDGYGLKIVEDPRDTTPKGIRVLFNEDDTGSLVVEMESGRLVPVNKEALSILQDEINKEINREVLRDIIKAQEKTKSHFPTDEETISAISKDVVNEILTEIDEQEKKTDGD